MTSAETGDGTAREIPVGRLASFEDEPTTPALSLPPRPSRRTGRTVPSPDDGRAPANAEPDATEQPEPAADAAPATAGAVRASNVHIPVALIDALNETKRTTRMSNGDIIITALEQTYEQLKTLIHPRPTTGGALFSQRVSRPPRTPITEPVTPLNYRLSTEDYAVLDKLVDDLGATSRSHLITVALSAYYKHQPPT